MTHSSGSWDLEISNTVFKYLSVIPKGDAEKILEIVRLLPTNPYFGDIKKMKGEDFVWRRRIGSYRIFYAIKTVEKVILVFDIDRRTSKTY